MAYYLKFGNKFVKKTKNRRIEGVSAILGSKKQAKIYNSITNAKKAKSAYEYQYDDLTNKLTISEAGYQAQH